ncbi:MAG TPA: putative toxin-antitoxin system toxin component, PIN family [Povalibacter sp.]|uniref:putative toxin-antitoxin system toxin component, PIN family n=1 Tax=Povalibacter sp. TaxID=1962978 RepID=UPI002BC4967A|nr:putative toxin-antitoxin system toxin component, PIN family [Povalibacter sp.]HMN43180.1 putative toxin-antitoxin system toxin component, PIN family [Povalibacter sp.]
MRYVLDTDVVTAGMRSPAGASAELLRLARREAITLLVSVPLFVEYEATCLDPEHRRAAGLTVRQVQQFLDALAIFVEPVVTHYLWRPQLRDPGDEMVLEAAVNGGADALVTFNRRDFGLVPARFGIKLWLPSEALRKVQ